MASSENLQSLQCTIVKVFRHFWQTLVWIWSTCMEEYIDKFHF